jgi:hypothetical protein
VRFDYFFINPRVVDRCEARLREGLIRQGAVSRVWAGPPHTQVVLAQFAEAADAHDFFTGMSIEFGAESAECTGWTATDGRPGDLEDVEVHHAALALEPGVFDAVNSWIMPSTFGADLEERVVLARHDDAVLFFRVMSSTSPPTPPADGQVQTLLDGFGAAIDARRPA